MTSEAPVEQGFMLPSQTSAPSKRSRMSTPDDPGYVPGVEYDQYDRYLLPEPDGNPGELGPWTRVTTLAGVVTSQEGLRVYTERKIARGFGLRADIRDLMASDPDSIAAQDEALAVAKVAAGVGAEARGGTARHSLLEHWANTGELRMDITEAAGRDLFAGVRKLTAEGITPVKLEQLVVNEHLNYAGRLDQLAQVTLPDGRVVLRILDAKFGKQVTKPYTRHQIGVQLALYANATHIYDPATRTFAPMSAELDRSTGYVLHVHNGKAELHEIDLIVGWQCAKTAILLHQQRRHSVTFLPVGQPVVVEAPEIEALRTEMTAPVEVLHSTPEWSRTVAQASTDLLGDSRPVETFTLPDIPDPLPNELYVDPDDLQGHREPASVQPPDIYIGTPKPPASAPLPTGIAPEPERSPSGRKRKACSKCRIPGHTAKNCPGIPGAGQPDPVRRESATGTGDPTREKDLGNGIVLCRHLSGWTVRPSDNVPVCADCGRPSEATAARMRAEEADRALATVLTPAVDACADFSQILSTHAPRPKPTLLERIAAVGSMEELGQLWEQHKDEWGEVHTTAAIERQARGLTRVLVEQ